MQTKIERSREGLNLGTYLFRVPNIPVRLTREYNSATKVFARILITLAEQYLQPQQRCRELVKTLLKAVFGNFQNPPETSKCKKKIAELKTKTQIL